ncbi:MAG: helix-turn-helix domain-containing protein [Acidobacteria bacterium]|nr:helix-turn-helix domain-containing protein [Acidobacteriota bacterium]
MEARLATATKRVDVQALRDKLKLSQAEFAHRFHFNRRTLQDWEQGRATPDSAVQAYLQVIERAPEVVAQALAR